MQPNIAVNKLIDMNINHATIKLVESFLSNRSQCVRYGNHQSAYQPCHIGVPQGAILGPVLLNIYINDLNPDVPYIKYADDSTLYHTIMKANADITDITPRRASILKLHENQLQNAADQASLLCENNRMLLNTTKSQSIIVTLQKIIKIDPIRINDSAVSNSDNVKLLGVTFDRNLKFSASDSTIIKMCRPIYHAMCQLRKAGSIIAT